MQKVNANLINVSGDILRLVDILNSHKENGGPSTLEFLDEYETKGTFRGVSLKGNSSSTFRQQFTQAVLDNLQVRFDSKLLKDCSMLDERRWPKSNEELLTYGDKEVMDVSNFFGQDTMTTVSAFREAKSGLKVKEYENFIQMIDIFPVSTAECERGFSALNDIHTRERNRLSIRTCDAILFLNINGPPISRVDFSTYVYLWLKDHRSAKSQDRKVQAEEKLSGKHFLFSAK